MPLSVCGEPGQEPEADGAAGHSAGEGPGDVLLPRGTARHVRLQDVHILSVQQLHTHLITVSHSRAYSLIQMERWIIRCP